MSVLNGVLAGGLGSKVRRLVDEIEVLVRLRRVRVHINNDGG
jgi:hypothetical protein